MKWKKIPDKIDVWVQMSFPFTPKNLVTENIQNLF